MKISVEHSQTLVVDCRDLAPHALMKVSFQKTLRLPDDGESYGLPPSLGMFRVYEVEKYKDKLPPSVVEKGGVFIGMYQAEALWISFSATRLHPFAVKLFSGMISCLTGERRSSSLQEKDYMVVPTQPWIDGFVTKDGRVSQFVAAPLGAGFSVEGQVTGEEKEGGLQFEFFPMKKEEAAKIPAPPRNNILRSCSFGSGSDAVVFNSTVPGVYIADSVQEIGEGTIAVAGEFPAAAAAPTSMGMAAGGSMHQEIYKDPHGIEVWDKENKFKLFVHLFHSKDMEAITGEPQPEEVTPKVYAAYNYPWLPSYGNGSALTPTEKLAKVKTASELVEEKGYGLHPSLMSKGQAKTSTTILLPKGGISEGTWE